MAQQESINLIQFQQKFHDEQSCKEHLFNMKWKNGFVCPKCGHNHYYFLKDRELYQCTNCKHQTSLTAGTVMHRTHTPILKWFWAIFLVGHDKRGISATQLAKDIDVSIPTAWLMLQKIRKAMGDRDSSYKLAFIVDMDDSYFGGKKSNGKRGRGTEKTPVMLSISLDKLGRPVFAKMEVLKDLTEDTFLDFAQRNILEGSTINTDGFKSCNILGRNGYVLNAENFDHEGNHDHLKWLHIIVSNAKAFVEGTYHGLDKKHLQAYLNEFCFRFNRRKFEGQMFNRILSACCLAKTIIFSDLTT